MIGTSCRQSAPGPSGRASLALNGNPVAEPVHAAATFLFTDLESSVSLWEEHPEAMRGALADHDQIVRGLIERHGGMTFKGTGDGFHALFDRPLAALEAAVAIHDAFRVRTWGALGTLQIR